MVAYEGQSMLKSKYSQILKIPCQLAPERACQKRDSSDHLPDNRQFQQSKDADATGNV